MAGKVFFSVTMLHPLSAAEPDRAERAALSRHIDERIEEELLLDPEAALPLCETFAAICDGLGVRLDPKDLPDDLLGLPAAPCRPPEDGPASSPLARAEALPGPEPLRFSP